jgi:hypothetical protein
MAGLTDGRRGAAAGCERRIEKGPHFRDPPAGPNLFGMKSSPGQTRLEFSTGPDIRTNTVSYTVLIPRRDRARQAAVAACSAG